MWFNCDLISMQSTKWIKKLWKLDGIKNFQFKKMEQGSNVKKVQKQVNRDERNMEANERLKCYQKMKINPIAFAIPILTVVNSMQSEQGKQM